MDLFHNMELFLLIQNSNKSENILFDIMIFGAI
jgi:hypothetical protein